MIPNIVRGSDPAGLVRYLFGKGRRNEHTDQHLVCASGDMFPSFDMDGKPAASYAEIGRRFDRRYRVRERKDDPFPPDMRGKNNPEREHGRKRVWHCSLAIKAGQGILTDQEWEAVIRDYLTRMNIIDGDDDQGVTWLAVRHGLSANGNDHVHIMVQLAADDGGWDALDGNERSRLVTAVAASTMPRQHVGRIVEACAKASRSEDEFIRRVRREGFSIDPRLRRGTAKDSFTDPGQVVGYRITWRSTDGWTERFNAFELGDDMRLKRLRDDWADDARSRALAVQEWRAAMENRPPFLDDGRERHLENLSTHDMERLVSEAFCIAASLNNAADDDEYRAAMREGLHTFDMLRERYGIAPEYGLWSMVASDEENRPRR